ncbi:unnamed protein product [Strongylus vulgaris]|uniref:ShKT domain-containing protein n=1 Tax=Strongylus vulgaris TaxID=40348 RepID=A0A3P7L5G5_STRVU|nr:unnamed protein product [Strongylus vulgaris]
MAEQCPLTCNKCNGATNNLGPAKVCQDLVHPRTGVSECPQRTALCQNPIYRQLMMQQCPKTCGYCV